MSTEEASTTLRLPADYLERADRLAEAGLGSGARVSRSVVLRRALELGLEALEDGAGAPSSEDVRAALAEIRARLAALERRRVK